LGWPAPRSPTSPSNCTMDAMGEALPDWRLFFEQAPVPLCVFDRALHLRAANVAFVAQYGWTLEELLRMRMSEAEGTGLGLATVYGIVEQHRGFTQIQSEPGAGTTVRVHIPRVDREVFVRAQSIRGTAPDVRGNETILLAEDEPSLRALAVMTLTALGYGVIAAADGEEAVREYELHAPDIALVVLDVIMARSGAREAYDRIRRIRPDARVLFTTGYAPESTRLGELIQDDRTQVLEKPFTPRELAARVRSAIDG
jgi:two-component system cell cycle sensor histidine kinase/response regulator CckA